MALNPNHAFEDLGEFKCSIVEKNCSSERVSFLQSLLEHNGLKVVVVKSPPPKAAPAKPVAAAVATEGAETPTPLPPAAEPVATGPETFTVGVTDLWFNPTNAIFNRELKTKDGQIVTPKYWQQKDAESRADIWYWKK